MRKGDIAEALFSARALGMGLNVSKAVGQDSRYDFVVEVMGKSRRVQVRSVWGKAMHGGHAVRMCHMRRGKDRRYRPSEVDFFAVYVAQHEAWYVIPAAAVAVGSISVFPSQRNTRGQYERYREAWGLLCPRGVVVGDIKAAADPAAEQSPVAGPFVSLRAG